MSFQQAKSAAVLVVLAAFVTIVVMSCLVAESAASPGHGIIRYYAEQKERGDEEDCRRLRESCRNSRGSDPRCTGPTISACFNSAAAPSASAVVTAMAATVAALVAAL